jgi:hypothetical protein
MSWILPGLRERTVCFWQRKKPAAGTEHGIMAFFRNFAKRPNWLFWALVGLSLFLHLGMLWKFRQIQPLKSDVFIEVTVAAPDRDTGRLTLMPDSAIKLVVSRK